eukprot:scaffold306748_cov23-Prasinocladus_malaysianus.AAC.1
MLYVNVAKLLYRLPTSDDYQRKKIVCRVHSQPDARAYICALRSSTMSCQQLTYVVTAPPMIQSDIYGLIGIDIHIVRTIELDIAGKK